MDGRSVKTPKKSKEPPQSDGHLVLGYLFAGLLGLIVIQWLWAAITPSERIPYSQFETLVAQGKVSDVTIGDTSIQGKLKSPLPDGNTAFTTARVEPALAEKLEAKGIVVTGAPPSGWLAALLSWVAPLFFFYLIWLFLLRPSAGGGLGGLLSVGKARAKIYVETDTKTTFADVAGVDEAKFELQEVVDFLKNPKSYGRLGAHVPKGDSRWSARREPARRCWPAPWPAKPACPSSRFPARNSSRCSSASARRACATCSSRRARRRPAIIFIDELDSLGRSRSGVIAGGMDEKEQTLNQLLAELDGFDPSIGVILLAATNRPEILDPALLRAGRFDRQVLVDRPDLSGRRAILEVHARKIIIGPDVDLDAVAGLTTGFTGADLANLVNEAALVATRRRADAVSLSDFTLAIERIVAGLEKKSRVLNPAERRRVAYHEMGHALVAASLPGVDPVHKVSIVPRGVGALGYTMQRPTEDRFLLAKSDLENRIAVLLGGRSAEALIFDGDVSTGAADDLQRATEIAMEMVTRHGMDSTVGLRVFTQQQSPLLGVAQVREVSASEAVEHEIDLAIRDIVARGAARAEEILTRRRRDLEEGVQILLAHETITADMFAPLRPVTSPRSEAPTPAAGRAKVKWAAKAITMPRGLSGLIRLTSRSRGPSPGPTA